MNQNILNIVKEEGIVNIINDYKKQMERLRCIKCNCNNREIKTLKEYCDKTEWIVSDSHLLCKKCLNEMFKKCEKRGIYVYNG